jgi:hypothetical protein
MNARFAADRHLDDDIHVLGRIVADWEIASMRIACSEASNSAVMKREDTGTGKT